jgi:hypothetical protein
LRCLSPISISRAHTPDRPPSSYLGLASVLSLSDLLLQQDDSAGAPFRKDELASNSTNPPSCSRIASTPATCRPNTRRRRPSSVRTADDSNELRSSYSSCHEGPILPPTCTLAGQGVAAAGRPFASAVLYSVVYYPISPILSTLFFPRYYSDLPRKKRLNWDAHVVSLVQSVLINGLALWVMFVDEERKNMDWEERIWGYTGAAGMIQAFAAGYFVWDLVVTSSNFDVFGPGTLAHAVAALAVFSLGFVSGIPAYFFFDGAP